MSASIYCDQCSKASFLEPGPDGKTQCPECGKSIDAPLACDVFISYASEDLERTREVAGLLGAAKISHWLAPDRVLMGEWFAEKIAEALSATKVVLLILSRRAVESQWVRAEIIEANSQQRPILPLKIEDFELPPAWRLLLSHYQWKEAFEPSFGTRADWLIERIQTELLRDAARPASASAADPEPRRLEPPPLEGVDPSDSPYVGPRPFPTEMGHKFFGRHTEAEALLRLITGSRIVLVYAPSGAGKSSLLNTLIRDSLEEQGHEVLLGARVGGALPNNVKADGIRNIFSFSAIYGLDDSATPDPQGRIVDYLRSIRRKPGARGRVVVFDQFEELFTQHRERFEHRAGFFEDVVEALEREPGLRIVLAIRQEYLADLEPHADALPEPFRIQRFALRRIDVDGALEAIVKPASRYATFAPGVAKKIADQLNTIRAVGFDGKAVVKRGEFIEMVHLQIVCDRLWNRLPRGVTSIEMKHLELAAGDGKTLDAFVADALNAFYDDTIENVVTSELTRRNGGYSKELLRLGCMKFITVASTRTMVQRSNGRTGRLPDWIVEQLEKSNLLRVEERGGQRWYELSHDSLAEPVGRQMNREVNSLLFAADLLDKVLENALHQNGGSLRGYFEEHRDILAECMPFHAQAGLFSDELEFVFRASLRSGQDMREWSQRLGADSPDHRVSVLQDALSHPSATVRGNAARVLGMAPVDELIGRLVDTAMQDADAAVRRAAALSLAKLDRPELYARLVAGLAEPSTRAGALEALSRIRAAADTFLTVPCFESRFEQMSGSQRGSIRRKAWRLRFQEGAAVFPFVFIPAASLATFAAACFKWLPGLFGWGVCQTEPSAAMGIFHGIIAGVVWAGLITLGITFYHVVFGREHGPKSALRPFMALTAGALSGLLSSLLVVLIVVSVYRPGSLIEMGWVAAAEPGTARFSPEFWRDIFVTLRFGWVYPILGTGLGVAMAMVTNAVRASPRWTALLEREHDGVTGLRETLKVTREILSTVLPYAWLLPVIVGLAAVLAFLVPDTVSLASVSKANPRALIEGLIGDGMTQVIGAYFGICGMALGLVVMRRGLHFKPQSGHA